MKQQINGEIVEKLMALNLPVIVGNGADISIDTEFLDAGWSTGSKKISYEASVFLDEGQQTVFMYEKTVEKGQGFSFGSNSESSFQSGTTLFRKVKSIQYGLDGKAFEYTLDLGAIPKAVKETTKKYGWKFKTVLSRNKASYPAGYVHVQAPATSPGPFAGQMPLAGQMPVQQQTGSFCVNCGAPVGTNVAFCPKCGSPTGVQQPQQQPPQYAYTAPSQQPAKQPRKKMGGLYIAGFIVLCLVMVAFYAITGVSFIGWVLGAAGLIGSLLLLMKFSTKGCLTGIIIFVVSVIILFIILAFTMSDNDNETLSNGTDAGGMGTSVQLQDGGSATSSAQAQGTEGKTDSAFVIDYLSIDSGPSINYDSAASYARGALSVRTRFILSFNTNPDYYLSNTETQNDTDVVKATLTVTPVSVPAGNFASFVFKQYDSIMLNPGTLSKQALPQNYVLPVYKYYDEATAAEESGEGNYSLYLVGTSQYAQLRFGTAILNVLPSEDLSTRASDQVMKDMISAAAAKGYTTDTLRYRVRVSLLLESKNGKKHLIEFERDVLPGGYDILTTKPGGAQYLEDYQSDKTNAPDDIYSKIVS